MEANLPKRWILFLAMLNFLTQICRLETIPGLCPHGLILIQSPKRADQFFSGVRSMTQAISGMMVCNGGTGFFVGGHADMQSDGTMERGVWNHITITYDGKLLRVYINGELDKEDPPGLQWGDQARELATVLDNGGIGTIGTIMNGDEAEEAFIFGLIDEVSIYDRTLSADEVKQNNDTPTQASGVVAVDTAGKLALTWRGIKLSR